MHVHVVIHSGLPRRIKQGGPEIIRVSLVKMFASLYSLTKPTLRVEWKGHKVYSDQFKIQCIINLLSGSSGYYYHVVWPHIPFHLILPDVLVESRMSDTIPQTLAT